MNLYRSNFRARISAPLMEWLRLLFAQVGVGDKIERLQIFIFGGTFYDINDHYRHGHLEKFF